MGSRLDVVEARIEDVARQNMQSMTEVPQQRIEDRSMEQQEQLDAVLRTATEDIRGNSKAVAGVTAAHARAAAIAAAARQRPQQVQQYDPDIVVIAGFKSDSPRALMTAWVHVTGTMRPFMTRDAEVFAPCILGAVLHVH